MPEHASGGGGGCLLPGAVCSGGGVCSGVGVSALGGVSGPGGVVSQHALRHVAAGKN